MQHTANSLKTWFKKPSPGPWAGYTFPNPLPGAGSKTQPKAVRVCLVKIYNPSVG